MRSCAAAAVAALSVVSGSTVAAPVRWTGVFAYDLASGGHKAGAAREWAEYRLTLKPDSCMFTARGTYGEETIRCTATEKDDGLDIRFLSYGNGKVVDERGNAVYAPGDTLFRLLAVKDRVLTLWTGYPLPDEKPHPLGVYFRPGHPAP